MAFRKQQAATAPAQPPFYITPSSPFSPWETQCCQCQQTSPEEQQQQQQHRPQQTRRCSRDDCGHDLCAACPRLDGRGGAVIPHAFPSAWVCSTCTSTHSVLEILAQDVACKCGSPTLQAVYDQFGRIFLYWRDDPAVYDLADPAKVQEAAWRVWEAGAEPWLADVLRAEAEAEAKLRGRTGRNRFS